MSLVRASLLVALSLALYAGGANAAERERLVVFPLDGVLASADRRLFDAILLSDLRREAALDVVPADEREVHVEATRSLGLGCARGQPVDGACAAEVGRLAAAKWAVLGEGSSEREVRLRLVEVASGEVAVEASAVLPPAGESFTPALRELLSALLAPTAAARTARTDVRASVAPSGDTEASTLVWWATGGGLLGLSALSAAASAGAFVGGTVLGRPPADGAEAFSTRDAWYAGSITLAVVSGVALVGGVGVLGYALLLDAPAAE